MDQSDTPAKVGSMEWLGVTRPGKETMTHGEQIEAQAIARENLLREIGAERRRQDAKWGGPSHDDHHSTADFVQLIEDYAGWARTMAGMNSHDKARQRLVQVAALALAACERIDRAKLGYSIAPL